MVNLRGCRSGGFVGPDDLDDVASVIQDGPDNRTDPFFEELCSGGSVAGRRPESSS